MKLQEELDDGAMEGYEYSTIHYLYIRWERAIVPYKYHGAGGMYIM